MIYEDLPDTDPANVENIEETALISDVQGFEYIDAYDQYIPESVILPKYYGVDRALVTRQKQYLDSNIIRFRHSNPCLDTCIDEVRV